MAFNNANKVATPTNVANQTLSFTRSTGEKWIYLNYPETLTSACLGDKNISGANKYLNQTQVNNGTTQLFASYFNDTGKDIYFGVQLYYAGSSTVSVTRQNNAFRTTPTYSHCDVDGGTWADFFASSGTQTFTLNSSNRTAWIFDNKKVPKTGFFNALLRFNTSGVNSSGKLWCFPYVYVSKSNLDGTAQCYPWKDLDAIGNPVRQYRGESNVFFLHSPVLSVNTSAMTSSRPYGYKTNLCSLNNPNEMISISDPDCSARTFSCPSANLGNWGAQYLFKVGITNNSTTSKTIKAYVGAQPGQPLTIPEHTHHTAIFYNGTTKWSCNNYNNTWQWLTDTLPANGYRLYEYQFIHTANSYSPIQHTWVAE